MKKEYQKWWSRSLGQDMELLRYGESGQPVLIFPAQGGTFYEYEDFGMVEACRPFIDAGKLQLVTVGSVDNQSWLNQGLSPTQRARRHVEYERYVLDEVVPWMKERTQTALWCSGCSMGGYHSANFFFRHPDVFHGVIALSGVYRLELFIGTAMDSEIYYHVPLAYLPGLNDPWYLERYRSGQIVICVGQGDWEEPMLTETRELARVLQEKQVPAWVDIWGLDVSHDWPWWKKQMPHFLEKLLV